MTKTSYHILHFYDSATISCTGYILYASSLAPDMSGSETSTLLFCLLYSMVPRPQKTSNVLLKLFFYKQDTLQKNTSVIKVGGGEDLNESEESLRFSCTQQKSAFLLYCIHRRHYAGELLYYVRLGKTWSLLTKKLQVYTSYSLLEQYLRKAYFRIPAFHKSQMISQQLVRFLVQSNRIFAKV